MASLASKPCKPVNLHYHAVFIVWQAVEEETPASKAALKNKKKREVRDVVAQDLLL